MKLQQQTIEKLRKLINEEIGYRSGPDLVSFLTNLVFKIPTARGSHPGGITQRKN